jgi:molybdopterin-guanine dinucleotide biosynthesis protein A
MDVESTVSSAEAVGVILAGGRALRMGGGDKSQLMLGDKTVLRWVVDAARPQVAQLMLNANGNSQRFAAEQLPVRADVVAGYAGPLAGILTGMVWAREQFPATEWLLSLAADTPFLPPDLADRLLQRARLERAQIVLAASADRVHPVIGLWHCALRDDLSRALQEEGARTVMQWVERYRWRVVDFSADGIDGFEVDPFFNINRPEDLEFARALCRQQTR